MTELQFKFFKMAAKLCGIDVYDSDIKKYITIALIYDFVRKNSPEGEFVDFNELRFFSIDDSVEISNAAARIKEKYDEYTRRAETKP